MCDGVSGPSGSSGASATQRAQQRQTTQQTQQAQSQKKRAVNPFEKDVNEIKRTPPVTAQPPDTSVPNGGATQPNKPKKPQLPELPQQVKDLLAGLATKVRSIVT